MPIGTEEQPAVAAPEGEPAAAKVAPLVGVSGQGRVTQTLTMIAKEFERIFPPLTVRWVFHSANKPELSNLMSRSTEGYVIVDPSDFGENPLIRPFADEKGYIRVADVVLMSIPRDQKEANRAARAQLSTDQLASVKDKFEASMDTVTQGRHRAVARGATQLEIREHDYNIEQRSQE